jgi:hypothetical protein
MDAGFLGFLRADEISVVGILLVQPHAECLQKCVHRLHIGGEVSGFCLNTAHVAMVPQHVLA